MDEELKEQEMNAENAVLTSEDVDVIGEILNISMGSAATAISTMLDQQVLISTPTVEVRNFSSLDYVTLEPAMLVKIGYVEGISGNNVMIFRQKDMQIILGLLMGEDGPPSDDFEFDELSISAACEVMNQMMGSSATALSEFLGRSINISTPEAIVVTDENTYRDAMEIAEGDPIVSVSFTLSIEGVMNSSFASILDIGLTKEIITTVLGGYEEDIQQIAPTPEPVAPSAPPAMPPMPPADVSAPMAPPQPMPDMSAMAGMAPEPQMQMPPQPMPDMSAGMPPQPTAPTAPPMPDMSAAGMQQSAQMPQQGYYPYPQQMPGYPPMPQGYPPYMPPQGDMAYPQSPAVVKSPVNVQNPQFPQFPQGQMGTPETGSNMDLLMQVSLDVSVEIGKAKRKIKEIVDFGQGTVIELNKQSGAPVDIVVNGCLIARGDVVVIEDNFGVRITEIVGSKELMEQLKEENDL